MNARLFWLVIAFVVATIAIRVQAADPLASWNDTASKRAIVNFVEKTTRQGSPDFVPPPERIATFDNDGTLWSEQPMYFQLFFALDRVKEMAPQHPEWKNKEPFASLLKGDVEAALAGGDKAILEIVMATHAGMTTTEFEKIVKDWIATARHPRTKRRYTEMIYQPMLELLAYLRANDFKTFIVSGGGIEFMRPLDRGGVRYPARAGRRQQHQNPVRDAFRRTSTRAAAENQLHR
jgi:phosphoglycolate phosphatase-like HAD superfamily hydrolase